MEQSVGEEEDHLHQKAVEVELGEDSVLACLVSRSRVDRFQVVLLSGEEKKDWRAEVGGVYTHRGVEWVEGKGQAAGSRTDSQ